MSRSAGSTSRALQMAVRGMLAAVSLFLLLAVVDLGGIIDAVVAVLFGWIAFLRRVIPRTEVNVEGLITAVVAAAGVTVLTHVLGRGLVGGWRARWSMAVVVLVVMMFVAGIAAIGITHQSLWVFRSSEPMFINGYGREKANRLKCLSNVHSLTAHVLLYANDHGGKFPDTLGQLVAAEDVQPSYLTCPTGEAPYITREHDAASRGRLVDAGQTAYVYLGRGLDSSVPPDTPIIVEAVVNHAGEGANVGFADGRAAWLTPQEVREVVSRRSQPATRPVANH